MNDYDPNYYGDSHDYDGQWSNDHERDLCREPSHGHARHESFCSIAYHDQVKDDDLLWSEQERLADMVVETEVDPHTGEMYPGYTLQLANCVKCHSTIARQR